MNNAQDFREQILAEARTWIGTAYKAQGALRGAGTDCSGLHRGVAAALGWPLPTFPALHQTVLLAEDWYRHTQREYFLEAFLCASYIFQVPQDTWAPGDIVLCAWPGRPASHAAFLSATVPSPMIIHALMRRTVTEQHIGPWLSRVRYVLRVDALHLTQRHAEASRGLS